ncbi:MAG TPA: protein-glutamate O-methyltransferase CheR [Longimicrobiales bacterium]|nr:protein-glutamate O-methyltransferase CheR [Longimicrobiales bacterium]
MNLPQDRPSLPLAQGELSTEAGAEFAALKHQIRDAVDFQCDGYKEKCLRRRIAVRMRARGVHRYVEYAELLKRDAEEYARLVDTLTINVSKFFRNPDVWGVVGERILPELLALGDPVINVWSAGTAGGEEAYTMAILAHEHAVTHGHSADRVRILGTDIDRASLAFAQRAEYTDFAMTDIDPAVRDRWFDGNGTYRLRPEARRRVRFAVLDLMRDEFPSGQHVILCRNVIIYFERAVQERLFQRFHDALRPGGFLVLGKVEALFGAPSGLFNTVANRQRVFRRP